MNNIRERLAVRSPDHEAAQLLAAFVAEHSGSDGGISVKLRLGVKLLGTNRALLERRVAAQLYPLRAVGDRAPTYSVSLAHATTSTAPYFAGALAVENSATGDGVDLILTGQYEPRDGVFGTVFDVTQIRRIVRSSVRDLLRAIASYIELASARNTAARAGRSAQAGLGSTLVPALPA